MTSNYEQLHTDVSADIAGNYLYSLFNHFFVSGYYLDLKNEKYTAIGQENAYSSRYGATDDWSRMDNYIRECIHPDDQALLTEVSRIDYIRDRLKKEQHYSVDVRDHGTGTEKWYRCIFMRGADGDHAGLSFVDVSDQAATRLALQSAYEEQNAQLEEIAALNTQLQENQSHLEEASAEQEAQLEEIAALNSELQENQSRLEEVSAEQEAQINEITALNGSLAEYNDIMASAGFGLWHIYLKDGAAPRMQVNRKMAELLGIAGQKLTEEELYNAWYDQIVPEAIPSVQASVAEMMAGKFSENTYQWVHPAKGVIWVRCGGTAVPLPDGTNVLRGYHADVTDIVAEDERQREELKNARRQAEEERSRVSDAYGMIYGLSQEYHTIWVVSKETSEMRLIRSSGVSTIQGAVQMGVDYPKFDAGFDKYINTYVEPEDRERMHREIAFAEILKQLRENPNKIYAVNYLRRDDSGHVGYHQIAFANADTQDGKQQFVYGFRDVDALVKEEQRQKQEFQEAKEAAEAANRAKTSFLFNMSHDIRTPMNAIMGFRDLLEKHQEEPEKRADYLRKIEDSCNVLLSIINNVLEMARIEKGTLEIEETPGSVEQFCDMIYSVFEVMMEQKDITFTQTIDVQHHCICCDPTKQREIFINILSNAYKYTNADGRVDMSVKELPCEREGWALYQTTVTDNGIGMSEEFLPHVFEEFAREHNTTDAKVEGTGLGLPIVKHLVEMLGGTIEVKSRKGEGSSFIVTIPHKIAEEAAQPERKTAEVTPDMFEGRRILLAEDNELNAEIATEILNEVGFEVDHAEDGAVCVEMLERSAPGYYSIILMDIQMPNMNGYEAARTIRALKDPAKANIKILAMTANAFEEDKREALRAGMNGHLAKPIDVAALMKTLAELIG